MCSARRLNSFQCVVSMPLTSAFSNRQLSSVSNRTCAGFYNSGTLAFQKSTFGGRQVRLGGIQASFSVACLHTCECKIFTLLMLAPH